MAQTRFTSQFHAEVEGGPWTSVAVWPADDPNGPINGWIFEVGEPVRLHGMAWVSTTRPHPAEDSSLTRQIYWISKFREGINGHEVSAGKIRGATTFVTMVAHLRKLDPLVRLAAEGSDGPAML